MAEEAYYCERVGYAEGCGGDVSSFVGCGCGVMVEEVGEGGGEEEGDG